MTFLYGVLGLIFIPYLMGKIFHKIITPKEQPDTFADWVMGLFICLILVLIGYVILTASYKVGTLLVG